MISFSTHSEGIEVTQWCEEPTVYLDHWAWRKISEDAALASNFATALEKVGGTLALSWLNLVEFCRVTDSEQRRKADALLNTISPRIFFINPDFFQVIEAENRILAGGPLNPPHSDPVSLKGFIQLGLLRPNALSLLPPRRLFQIAPETDVAEKFDDFAEFAVSRICALREEHTKRPEFRRLVRGTLRGSAIQHGTRFIARELLSGFFRENARLNANDAIDICHAIVAVSYCDLVLLDGRWVPQIERSRKRFRQVGMSFPVARVFSERDDGLEQSLRILPQIAKATIS